jgi:hypothetical protein
MIRFEIRVPRRQMWSMGLGCSLLLLATGIWWVFEGSVSVRVTTLGVDTVHGIRREHAAVPFWLISGFLIITATASTIITAVGLARAWHEKKSPNQAPKPKPAAVTSRTSIRFRNEPD